MRTNVLLSVIVSTYNSELFFEGKLKDLISQSIFNETEIIIINSGSLENEDELVKGYLNRYSNIKYYHTSERESIYKAWNRAIELSSSEFITNGNTDDRLKTNAFETLVKYLRENPEIALVYADQYITPIANQTFEEAENYSGAKAYQAPDYEYFKQLDRGLVFSQPMWRASLHFKDNIWYDEKYEICGDYDFQLKISQKYKMLHVPELLGTFYLSSNRKNKSHNNLTAVIKERQKISEPYIRDYIGKMAKNLLEQIINNDFKEYLNTPIPLFYIWKRLNLLVKSELVYKKYFYTIEFVYFFTVLALIKLGDKNKALKLANHFLRYSNSERIILERKKILNSFKLNHKII